MMILAYTEGSTSHSEVVDITIEASGGGSKDYRNFE
jgi:hypothetical protein